MSDEERDVYRSPDEGKRERKSRSNIFVVLAVVVSKAGKIFAALKALKFAKFFFSMMTMAFSAFAYGFYWHSWWFGIGLVTLLFVHEMGHVAFMKMKGMETKWPVFIPFLGAAIFVQNTGSRTTEAFIGYGGPLVGALGTLIVWGVWYASGQTSTLLIMLVYVGLFLNLFNLIPARPLDGGRILRPLGNWVSYVGGLALLGLFFLVDDPAFLFILLLVLLDMRLPPKLKFWLGAPLATFLAAYILVAVGEITATGWLRPLFISLCIIGLLFFALTVFMLCMRAYGASESGAMMEYEEGVVADGVPAPPSGIVWCGSCSILRSPSR